MGYSGQKEEEKALQAEEASKAARTAAFAEILKDPKVFEDGQYAFGRLTENGLYEPEPAIKLAQAFQTFGQAQGERDPEKAMKYVPILAAGYVAADEETRPMLRGPLQTWLSSANLEPEGGWERVEESRFLAAAEAYAAEAEKAEGAKPGSFEAFVAAKYPNATPEQMLQARKEWSDVGRRPLSSLTVNPQKEADLRTNAQAIVDGRLIPGLMSKRGGDFNRYFALADQLHQEQTGKKLNHVELLLDFEAAKRFTRSLNSPQMVRFQGLGKAVVNTIDEVHNLAKRLKQGGIRKWNQVKRESLLEVYGNTPYSRDAVKYLAAVNTLKEEFASLAQGGYAPTGPAWELADKQINADFGVKDLDASLVEVQRLINYRLGAFEELEPMTGRRDEGPSEYEPATEITKDDFADAFSRMSPEQLAAFLGAE
jgi:hypothetical protein